MSEQKDAVELTLNIDVNGDKRAVLASTTLAELVAVLGHQPERVATAVNGSFVARGRRGEHVLREGDKVSCFEAIVGG